MCGAARARGEGSEQSDDRCGPEDPAYVADCAIRCIACLCQTLFALNRIYLLTEKGAMAGVGRLAVRPEDFAARIRRALDDGAAGLAGLSALVDKTGNLLPL